MPGKGEREREREGGGGRGRGQARERKMERARGSEQGEQESTSTHKVWNMHFISLLVLRVVVTFPVTVKVFSPGVNVITSLEVNITLSVFIVLDCLSCNGAVE